MASRPARLLGSARRSLSSTPTKIPPPRQTWACSAANTAFRRAPRQMGAYRRSTRPAARSTREPTPAGRWRSHWTSSGPMPSHLARRSCWSRPAATASPTCSRPRTTRRLRPSTCPTPGATRSSPVRTPTTPTLPSRGSVSSSHRVERGRGRGRLQRLRSCHQRAVGLQRLRPGQVRRQAGHPDVSLDADPASGVSVYDSTRYQGQKGWWTVGGTSASSPMWAARSAVAGAVVNSAYVYGTSISYRDIHPREQRCALPGRLRPLHGTGQLGGVGGGPNRARGPRWAWSRRGAVIGPGYSSWTTSQGHNDA